jgi:hypothetical protein
MPAYDVYYETVKNALLSDNWTITHDPLKIRLRRGKRLFVNLGAERLLGADRGTEKIAVEIKSFRRAPDMKDVEEALGQFTLYKELLRRSEPERTFFFCRGEDARGSI